MKPERLDPARSIIAKIGVEKVADITGRHVSRVYRWMQSQESGGTGGMIPNTEAQKLLAWARETGFDLSPAEFFAASEMTPAPATGEAA